MEEFKNYCTRPVIFRQEFLLILLISLLLGVIPLAIAAPGVNITNSTNVTNTTNETFSIELTTNKVVYIIGELANITISVIENGLPFTGMGHLSLETNNSSILGADINVEEGYAATGMYLDTQFPGNYSIVFSVGNHSNSTNIQIVKPVQENQTNESQVQNETETINETSNKTFTPFLYIRASGKLGSPISIDGKTNLEGNATILVTMPSNMTYLDIAPVRNGSFSLEIPNITNQSGEYIVKASIENVSNTTSFTIKEGSKQNETGTTIELSLNKDKFEQGDIIKIHAEIKKNENPYTGFAKVYVKKENQILLFVALPVISGVLDYGTTADFDTPGYYTLTVVVGGTSRSLDFYYGQPSSPPMPNTTEVPPLNTTNETEEVEVNISVSNIINETGLILTNATIPGLGTIRVLSKSRVKHLSHIGENLLRIETTNKTDKLDLELPFSIPKGLHYYAWVKTPTGFKLAKVTENKLMIEPNATSTEVYIAKPPKRVNVSLSGSEAKASIDNATFNMKTNSGKITNLELVAPSTIPNNTKSFPYGLVKFNISNVSGEAKINITFDRPVARFGEYWKFDPESFTWKKMPFTILNDTTIQIVIEDNGPFDEDPRLGYVSDDSGFETSWWNYSWSWRKVIEVTGSSSNLTDYQVKITVDTASLISAGKMNSDCSDVRFTYWNDTSTTETKIPYYLVSGCNSANTVIWVKIPFIRASSYGNETIFMYYGNSGASSESNFSDVWGTESVTASYNSTLGAPSCDNAAKQCTAPSSLLQCNDNQNSPGPEPNQPNTIDSCSDSSTSGTCHSDESIESITVEDLNGTAFKAGDTIRVNVTAYCWGTNDYIAVFYTNSTSSVNWVRVSPTGVTCAGSHDYETFSYTFKLNSTSGYHAVRGVIKYSSDVSSACDGSSSSYTDQDDLAFKVMIRASPEPSTSVGVEEYKNEINITIDEPEEHANVTRFEAFTFNGTISRLRGTINNLQAWAEVIGSSSTINTIIEDGYDDFSTYTSKDNITVAHAMYLQISGDDNETPWWNTSFPYRQYIQIQPNSDATDYVIKLTLNSSNVGSNFDWTAEHLRFIHYNRTDGTFAKLNYWVASWNSGGQTADIWLKIPKVVGGQNYTITMYYGNSSVSSESSFNSVFGSTSETAAYNSTLGAPICDNATEQCTAPSSLLQCNDNQNSPGPEPNQPNTIDTCADSSTSGTCHSDESIESITVEDLNGTAFKAGDTIRVNVTAYCWGTNDYIAVFYTNSTSSVNWVRVSPTGVTCANSGDYETFSYTFKLNSTSGYHAVRGVIKYSSDVSTACDGGNYIDKDDLAFKVLPTGGSISYGSENSLTYETSGEYISSTFDTGVNTPTWKEVFWQSSTNENTSISVYTRSSSDGNTWSTWYAQTNNTTIQAPARRYLQYKVVMSTTNNKQTPELSNITLKYIGAVQSWQIMQSSDTDFTTSGNPNNCGDLNSTNTQCNVSWSVTPRKLGPYSIRIYANNSDIERYSIVRNVTVWAKTYVDSFTSNSTVVGKGRTIRLIAHLTDDLSQPLAGRNITFYDETDSTVIGYAITNSTGYAVIYYTPPSSATIGNHILNASFNGSSTEYLLPSSKTLTVKVSSVPQITNVGTTPEPGWLGYNLTIYANITDEVGINAIKLNITYPNGTLTQTTMTNVGGDRYEYNLTDTWRVGTYTYKIWVNNTDGIESETDEKTFTIESYASFDFRTEKNVYKNYETVHLNITTTEEWWNSSWKYRIPINISSSTTLTDYQIEIDLNKYNFNLNLCEDNGADLRFLWYNSTSGNYEKIPYWVEEWNTTSGEAKVWIKVPELNTNTKLYMYYGNSGASSESNASSVFLFFDDFNGTSLDSNKWDTYNAPSGNYDVQNGVLRMWGNWGVCCSGGCVYNHTNTKVTFTAPFAVETRFMVNGSNSLTSCCQICYATVYNNTDMISISSDGDGFVFRIGGSRTTNTYYFPDKGKWHRITEIFDTDKLMVKTDYANTYTYSGSVQSSGPIGLAGDTDTSKGYDVVDWIAVRKYSDASIKVDFGKPNFYKAGLKDDGPAYTQGYLHMKVQKWDEDSGQWVTVGAPVVDNEKVSGPAFGSYDITTNWESDGAWSTSAYEPGRYRVVAQLFGPNYLVLNNSYGNPIMDYYEFNITSAILEVTNLTHENKEEHSVNEYEVGDKIDWVNVTVKAINNTAINANITLNVLKDGNPVSWGPNGTKSCGNIPENQTCERQWNNSSNGYLIPLDAASGSYMFNWSVTMDTDNGPTRYNSTMVFTIHNIPSTFNHSVTKSRLYKPDWTYYNFTFKNLWSKNLTNVNVTINCPTVSGMSCSCVSSGTDTCNLGNINPNSEVTVPFNVSVDNTTPSSDYHVNVTITYTNPGGEIRAWSNKEDQVIEVRQLGILEIHTVEYPVNVTRQNNYDFSAYINNTGDPTANNVWLNYTLPSGWSNSSGDKNKYQSSLGSGNIMWNNITANVGLTSQLGEQTVRLDSESDNVPGDFKELTVYVWAKTNFSEFTSNASDWGINRGDTLRLIARLVLDNGTAISGETVEFWDNTSGVYLGSATTNSTGYAVIDYTIPMDASLGYHTFNVSFSGDSSKYYLETNATQNIRIHSTPYSTDIQVTPTNLGYGYNVSISATLGDQDGDTITDSKVKIKYPNGTVSSYECFVPPDTCSYTFNNTWWNGTYNVTIWVEDDTGTTNESEPYNFTVETEAEISAQTMEESYGQNEDVLLSNKTWLNDTLSYRIPINVSNSQSTTLYEYQVLITYNFSDIYSNNEIDRYCHSIRFSWLNGSSNTEEEIPHYTVSCDLEKDTTAKFWVKVPEIPAGSSTKIFMYYGRTDLNDTSNITQTFSYSEARIIGYVVSNNIASNGVAIASLADSNTIIVGSNTYNLDELGTTTTGALSKNTAIKAKSLAQIVGRGSYDDIIVPVSFAGTEFVYSGMRDSQDTICMLAPFTNANVTIYVDGSANWTGTVNSTGTCITYNYGTTSAVRINSDVPILAYYYGKGSDDSWPMVPASSGPWYGVPSNYLYLANDNNSGTVYINGSNGQTSSQSLTSDDTYSASSLGADGSAPAFKLWGNVSFSAIQQADSDGTESTTFYPETELSTKYGAPNGLQYIAIASPYNTQCRLYNTSGLVATISLSGSNGVYKGCYNCGNDNTVISGAWKLECDKPVYAYYENSNAMETNLLGWLQMRQYTYPGPSVKYETPEERPAKVYNRGNSFKGYLQMYVERNETGTWEHVSTVLNDSSTGTLRDIGSSGLDLASLWNQNPWNTDSEDPGYYRVCAKVVTPNGDILNTTTGMLYTCHIFRITPPPTYVNITNITVYEVTDALESNWHIYTNDYVDSGLNKTFTFYKDHVYRIEVTVKNIGNTTWEINESTIKYMFLDNSWLINATRDIWYSNATDADSARSDSDYEGGSWNGNVTWNSSLGGVVTTNNTATFFFVVNITTTGTRSVKFSVNISGTSEEDISTWQIVEKDTTPPQLYNNIYNLTNNDILRGESTTVYARWDESIDHAEVQYNSTSSTLGSWLSITLPDPNPQNWTNYTITTTSSWILGRHVVKIRATDLSNNTNDTLSYLWFNVSGLAQVTDGQISPNPVNAGSTTHIYCKVTDHTDADSPISGYTVSFYDGNTLLGTNTTNSSGWAEYSYIPSNAGYHTIVCNISADPSRFYKIDSNNNKTMTLTVSETEPPQWHEVIGPTLAHKGDTVDLDVKWTDNYALNSSVLSTNASGSWENVSSLSLSGTDSWANFSYQIPTDIDPGYISWKQYANDSWGNTNVTNEQTIEVWGWSEVYAIDVNPASVQEGNSTTISCQVVDANDTGTAISSYTVTFYDGGTQLGTNTTNSSGWATYTYTPSGVGTHTVKCEISDDASKKYNASDQYYLTHALTVTSGPDTTPPQIVDDTYQINATSIYRGECVEISGQWDETVNYSKVIYNITSPLVETHIPTPYTNNWTNYTLCTNSSWSLGPHVAKLWANDTSGNINDSLPYKNFTVWGKSKVEWVSPASNANLDRGQITLECRVLDKDYSTTIENYPVKFYDDNGYLIGENYTNSSGIATVVYDATNRNVGPATFTCKINSNSTLHYNTTSPDDQAARTFNFYGSLNISIVTPTEGTIVHRTENVTLESTIADENNNQPLDQSGQPATLDVKWWNSTANIATGQNTSWIVSVGETLGPETIKVNVSADYYHPDEDNVSVTVYGWSEISVISPANNSGYKDGETINIICRVTDANATNGIENYPVKVYDNSTLLGTYHTNSTGYISTTESTNSMSEGTHDIKCEISDNSTLYYNASTVQADSFILVDKTVPNIYYNPSTDSNGTYNRNWTIVNVTATDAHLDQVLLYWNGSPQQFQQHSGDYYWSNITGLSDGVYTFYGWANDTVGNTNQTSVREVRIDTTPPSLTIVSPENKTYATSNIWFNVSSNENVSTCWYNLDGGSNNTLTKLNETYAYGQGSVLDGTHTAYFYCNDTVGNIGTKSVVFTVDTTPPTVTLNEPANATYTNQTTITFNCSASDNIKIKSVSLYGNFSGTWAEDQTNTSGVNNVDYLFSKSLSDGAYIWNCKACDDVNCAFGTNNWTLVIDTIAPIVSIQSPENKTYNVTSIGLNYTVSDDNLNDTCYYSLDGGASQSLANCANTTLSSLSQGNHHVVVWAYDKAGNKGQAEVYFTVDTTPPTVTIQSPQNTTYTDTNNIDLNYSVSDNYGVSSCWYVLDGGSAVDLPSCQNTTLLGLSNGNHHVVVYAKDEGGNTNSSDVYFAVNVTNLTVTIQSPLNGSYVNSSWVWVNATTNKPANSCNYSMDSGSNQTMTNDTLYHWYANATGLSEGSHQVYVYCSDGSQTVSDNSSFTVDLTNPSLVVTSPENTTYATNSVNLNYTASDNYGIDKCYYDLDSNGYSELSGCSNTTLTGLPDGSHNVKVKVVDLAGNINETTVYFTVDTTPPTLTIVSPENKTYNVSTLWFNVSSNENVDQCWYNVDGGSNTTMTKLNDTYAYAQGTLPDGTHTAYFYCNDTVGNIGTKSVVFTVDTTGPVITFVPPTPANNAGLDHNWTYINITTDEDASTAILEWEYPNGNKTNHTMNSNNPRNWWYNITDLQDGTYYYKVYANDSLDNWGVSETRKVIISVNAPAITIWSPENKTYNTTNVIDLNVTASKPVIKWWMSLNGRNFTFTPNTTIAAALGTNHLVVYAEDAANKTGNASVDFTVNTTSWADEFDSPVGISDSINATTDGKAKLKFCWPELSGGCWPYRKPITITSSGTLTNFQVKLELDLSTEYSNGKVNSDCSDLRFTWYNSTSSSYTKIPYWIENCNVSGTTAVWIKVPEITTSGSTVYVYYGNPNAESESNGTATFEFYDTMDTLDQWTVSDWVTESGVARANSSGGSITADYTFPSSYAIEMRIKGERTSTGASGFLDFGNNNDKRLKLYLYPYDGKISLYNGSYNDYTLDCSDWHDYRIIADFSNDDYRLYIDNSSTAAITLTGAASGAVSSPQFYAYNANGTYVDWIRIRKYASTPTVSVGSEQMPTTSGWMKSITVNPGLVIWKKFYATASVPSGTSLVFRILNSTGDSICGDITPSQASAGYDICSEAQNYQNLTLYAYMSTTSGGVTPEIDNWNITWEPLTNDLVVNNIAFNTSSPIEGHTILVSANVSNAGTGNLENVTVELKVYRYNGTAWILKDTQNTSINVTGLNWTWANFTWTAEPGTWNFTVTADPENNITESNEANNVNSTTYNVSSWQIMYGKVNGWIEIADASGHNFTVWIPSNTTGNLYFSDIDSNYDMDNLEPLNGTNDLKEADQKLNMTGSFDSIEKLYDKNDDGTPDSTACFDIGIREVCNVPVVNSTDGNNGNFITGILWDSGDGGTQYDGTQDLVFITKINENKTGSYGTYDYEARVPSALRNLVGSQDRVAVYLEIK